MAYLISHQCSERFQILYRAQYRSPGMCHTLIAKGLGEERERNDETRRAVVLGPQVGPPHGLCLLGVTCV
jgi:hypothetical protein